MNFLISKVRQCDTIQILSRAAVILLTQALELFGRPCSPSEGHKVPPTAFVARFREGICDVSSRGTVTCQSAVFASVVASIVAVVRSSEEDIRAVQGADPEKGDGDCRHSTGG